MLKKLSVLCLLFIMLIATGTISGQGDVIPDPQATPEGSNLPLTGLLFETEFTTDDGWPDDDDTEDLLVYEITDEGYAIQSTGQDAGVGSIPFLNINIDNYYTEIEFTIDECAIPESALLFFTRFLPSESDVGNDSFVFVMQCDGNYRARGLQGEAILDVVDSGVAEISLEQGQSYTIGFLLSGNNAAWYINGATIATFEVPESDIRSSGSIAPGAQRGLAYTLNRWRIWSIKNSGENIEEAPEVVLDTPTEEDPLTAAGIGDPIYDPSFELPGDIPLGLTNPIAATLITGEGFSMYNRQGPDGVLVFDDVDQADYYMEATFSVRGCEPTSTVGFVWRADEALENHYTFELECSGQFRAYAVADGVPGDILLSGQLEPALTELETITIGIYVQGDAVSLYSGTTAIETFTDDTYTSGLAGLRLGSGTEDMLPMNILATDVTVYDLP